MKKIGLVTVTYVNNYGSHLQSFALQEKLKNLGYCPQIINIDSARKDIEKRRKKYVLTRLFNFSEIRAYIPILKRKIALKIDKEYHNIYTNRARQFNSFANTFYAMAPKVTGWEGLKKQCAAAYDAVIVGSDQNWRPANIAGGFYTLEFVPDKINKIAYATSFGIDHVKKTQQEQAKKFLARIKHLSVREESGQKIVKKLLNRDIPVVCDPTLLLSQQEWDQYIPSTPLITGKYILVYFLGANKAPWAFAQRLKRATGLKIVGIPYGENYVKGGTSYIDYIPQNIGPFEFINLIKNASYICTDSFHGCVFSISYNKNLFAFYKFAKQGPMSTNGRIDSLFKWTGLTNRIFSGYEDITNVMLRDINYIDVNESVRQMRDMSLLYLKNSIENICDTDLKN